MYKPKINFNKQIKAIFNLNRIHFKINNNNNKINFSNKICNSIYNLKLKKSSNFLFIKKIMIINNFLKKKK